MDLLRKRSIFFSKVAIRKVKNHNGDGGENKRHLKSDFAFFETSARLSQLGHFVQCRQTFLELNSKEEYSSLKREREIRRRMFTLSIKREIRQFTP